MWKIRVTLKDDRIYNLEEDDLSDAFYLVEDVAPSDEIAEVVLTNDE
jgi:hypothetical protein